jgi:phosphoglycolate phosphatase
MMTATPAAEPDDTLVLWDIDGTLISTGPAAAVIYPQAFQALTGRPVRHTVDIQGRTEFDTVSELFALHDLPEPPEKLISDALTQALRSQIVHLRAEGRVLAGVVETLTLLAQTSGMRQTLLTGNLRVNAELKMHAFGLAELVDFDIGGYGCDHRIRSRLVSVARQRATERGFTGRRVVLIGDTVRDVQAGLDNGILVIAVATGETSAAELQRAGADIVLSDLTDPAAVLAAVQGNHGTRPRH